LTEIQSNEAVLDASDSCAGWIWTIVPLSGGDCSVSTCECWWRLAKKA